MTDKEKLIKILEKARENKSRIARQYLVRMQENPNADWSVRTVVMICCFDKSFAKAYWNERGGVCAYCGATCPSCRQEDFMPIEYWKYHLKQLVLADDKIEYLWKFIGDDKKQ